MNNGGKRKEFRAWYRVMRVSPRLCSTMDKNKPWFNAGICLRFRLEQDPLTIPVKVRLSLHVTAQTIPE